MQNQTIDFYLLCLCSFCFYTIWTDFERTLLIRKDAVGKKERKEKRNFDNKRVR